MIVVTSILSRIGSLLKVGTPEQADTMLRLSNTYLGPLPYPIAIPSNQGVNYSDSFGLVAQSTITNTPGGATTTICSLVAGIWELSFLIDSEFNWLNANPLAQDNRIILQQQTGTLSNIELWSSAAKVARSLFNINRYKITLAEPMNLRLLQNGNGVGQTSTVQFHILANRLL